MTGARFALLTPRGHGGVAVVAIRGPGRAAAAGALLRHPSGAPLVPAGGPRTAVLVVAGEPLDQVLVVDRTDQIEIHLHGSEAVLAALERRTGPWDATVAGTPAERLLAVAMSDAQLALALEQRSWDWAAFVAELRERPAAERREPVAAARARSRVAMALAEPARLVLCGAQNAGKSTLMNRLLFAERALTGARPGLTRDPVREPATLAGYPYLLIDTAGEGRAASAIDQQAVERGRSERAGALRLLVVDGQRAPGPLEMSLLGPDTLIVRHKIDLPQAPWPELAAPVVGVSSLDPAGASRVRELMGGALRELRGLPVAGPVGGPAALEQEQCAELDRL